MSVDPPCPNPDNPLYVQVWEKFNMLRHQNERKEFSLRQQYGPNARLSDVDALEQRLNMITNALLPIETVERVELEVAWQEFLGRSLENLHASILETIRLQKEDAAKPKLHLPGKGGIL